MWDVGLHLAGDSSLLVFMELFTKTMIVRCFCTVIFFGYSELISFFTFSLNTPVTLPCPRSHHVRFFFLASPAG